MKSRFLPFSDLVQISPDGDFILISPDALRLTDRRFADLRDFIEFAFEYHEHLAPLYPVEEACS